MSTTADNNAMLTRDEALSFLKEVLCMTLPEEGLTVNNRVAFMGDYMKAMQHHIPFQTIRSLSTPPSDRHLPTISEIKRDVTKTIGGMCYDLNPFSLILFRALSFNVSIVSSDVLDIKDCHTVVIAHDLTDEGSKHVVDVGVGAPAFRPIPLDFREMSPEYQDSFLRYKFVRRGDVVIRQHKIRNDAREFDDFKAHHMKDGWFNFCYMKVSKPVDIAFFDESMTKMYTVILPGVPFLQSLRCFAFPNGRFVCIRDTTLLVEDEKGHMNKSYFRSRDEIVEAFARFFPQFPEEMVRAAMDDNNLSLDFNK